MPVASSTFRTAHAHHTVRSTSWRQLPVLLIRKTVRLFPALAISVIDRELQLTAGRLLGPVFRRVNRPGESFEDEVQSEVELVPEVIPGFEDVLGGNLNQVRILPVREELHDR